MNTRSSPVENLQPVHEEGMRIGGKKIFCDRVIDVLNPYTGELVGTVPKASIKDVRSAFEIAASFRSGLSRHQRYEILIRSRSLIESRRQEIAKLITSESGLCIKDTQYEVMRACDVLLFSANQALIDDGQVFSCDLTANGRARKVYTTREPLLGVIAAITPFNHPLNQVVHKVAPAVASNNRIVIKPSEKTPLTALVFADILYEAGLPVEMLQIITGDPGELGDAIITAPNADVVTFTGSCKIGHYIANKAGYKRLVLELGGNDPLIVMNDADPVMAAQLAVQGAYRNSGQRCTAVKRILVQEDIAADFVAVLTERTRALKGGSPLDSSCDMGTVIDEAAAKRIESLVVDAVEQGAELLHGGSRDGAYLSPTVLDRVRPNMPLVTEETFGPIAPVIRFKDAEEAIQIANSSNYALSAGVCTSRIEDITRFISNLHAGTVNIWEVPGYRLESTPFGGIKDSGLGYKEGVIETMRAFTNQKTYSLPW